MGTPVQRPCSWCSGSGEVRTGPASATKEKCDVCGGLGHLMMDSDYDCLPGMRRYRRGDRIGRSPGRDPGQRAAVSQMQRHRLGHAGLTIGLKTRADVTPTKFVSRRLCS